MLKKKRKKKHGEKIIDGRHRDIARWKRKKEDFKKARVTFYA